MRRRQCGFTYLLAIFAVAAVGALAAAAAPRIDTYERRQKEIQLLFVGHQFRHAIASYYESSPGTTKRYPRALEELLEDRRFLVPQRHLRKIYIDPFLRRPEWGLIRDSDGRIVGVHSLHGGTPIKQANFSAIDEDLVGATSYRQWRFVYRPRQIQMAPESEPGASPRPHG